MDPHITLRLVLLAFLFILSGFFSGSEASLFSLTSLHLHKMRTEKSQFLSYVQKLLKFPRRLLITILVGNESVNVAISVVAAAIFIFFLGKEGKWVAIVITTPLLLIFGEAIPKTFAITNPMRFSSFVSLPLTFFSRIARPVVWVLEKISGWFVNLFGMGDSKRGNALMEDEFKTLVDVGHEEGVLEKPQRDLINRVFELRNTSVSDVMTPRVDMFCLPVSMDIKDVEREIVDARYSRVPIYGSDSDDILGILYAKDLLSVIAKKKTAVEVGTLLRKPYFVPLEKRADSLLGDFQTRKIHMAIVVDEYGGVAGIVTMEDILESLFGDIHDEYDVKEDLYRRIDEKTLLISGMMPVNDFNDLAGTSISSEDFDTVGGFVFHLFGKLPARGEDISFDNYTFSIEKMSGRRILEMKVTTKEVKDGE
ncbi:MAG: hemolysin family protein [Thermodesulfobacteriota bacterium]|nr:hemolysin family protein [Thermodesulfobacteriota bacterium]